VISIGNGKKDNRSRCQMTDASLTVVCSRKASAPAFNWKRDSRTARGRGKRRNQQLSVAMLIRRRFFFVSFCFQFFLVSNFLKLKKEPERPRSFISWWSKLAWYGTSAVHSPHEKTDHFRNSIPTSHQWCWMGHRLTILKNRTIFRPDSRFEKRAQDLIPQRMRKESKMGEKARKTKTTLGIQKEQLKVCAISMISSRRSFISTIHSSGIGCKHSFTSSKSTSSKSTSIIYIKTSSSLPNQIANRKTSETSCSYTYESISTTLLRRIILSSSITSITSISITVTVNRRRRFNRSKQQQQRTRPRHPQRIKCDDRTNSADGNHSKSKPIGEFTEFRGINLIPLKKKNSMNSHSQPSSPIKRREDEMIRSSLAVDFWSRCQGSAGSGLTLITIPLTWFIN